MTMNRADILAINDLNSTVIDVPLWGKVRIKGLSIEDQIHIEKMKDLNKDDGDFVIEMVLLSCIDDNGSRLFVEDDRDALKKKSSVALLKIFHECLNLNKLNPKDLEDKAKNS